MLQSLTGLLSEIHNNKFIIGPPTHSVGVSVVVVCNTPICNVTHQGAARDGGPLVLRPDIRDIQ